MKTIRELVKAYREKKTSPLEICQQSIERVERLDSRIGAFLSWDAESIRFAAREAEKNLDKPLAGIPIAIKDVLCTKGTETTACSRILKGFVPPYDATAVRRLKEAGAILFGKTNCDEFAMGSSTENSAYQLTRNPWNLNYTPGGSSGGSAAAVAASFVYGALGTDTGGSIRQPAAFCGVIGLKPTYGRVSRYGLIAFGSSLDCIGPMTRSVEDAALLLQVIAGKDFLDSTSAAEPVPDYLSALKLREPIRVGIPKEYFGEGLDPEVERSIREALAWMEKSGKVELKSISLPHTRYAIATYYIIATAEASSNLSRYDGVKYGIRKGGEGTLAQMYDQTRGYGFGPEVKRRIMLGTFALSSGYYDAYYSRASRVRTLIAGDFQEAFQQVDLLCTPTAPTAAFCLGEKIDDPLSMYLSDVYTVTVNLAGLPAISIPCGFHSSGLPIGLQIIGNYLQETKIFQLASFFEQEHPVPIPEL